MGTLSVSVAIPTRNAGRAFAETLEAIKGQRHRVLEIVVVDSGSTDGTVDVARNAGARVITIAPQAYGHGCTRNLLVSECRGELVLLTVQDAIPADDRWLTFLLDALEECPDAAGAFSRALPHRGAGFISRQMSRYQDMARGTKWSVRRMVEPSRFARMTLDERRSLCAFDNVSGIIRRCVWEAIPFRDLPFAEDLAWGLDVLRAGHSIVHEPRSMVRHSHERTRRYWLQRAYVEAKATGEILGVPRLPWYRMPARTMSHFAQVAHGLIGEAARQHELGPRLTLEIVTFAIVESIGQSLGAVARYGPSAPRCGFPGRWLGADV